MKIHKTISTKYGEIPVEFLLDCGIWIASYATDKLAAVIQANSLTEAEQEIVKSWEYIFEFNEIRESNPHKDKVDLHVLHDINVRRRKFWEIEKN